VLYEIGIIGARVWGRRKVAQQEDGGAGDPEAGQTGSETMPTGTAGYRVR
jgi:hypothetical protein